MIKSEPDPGVWGFLAPATGELNVVDDTGTPEKSESKVEAAKRNSRNLRGTIAETLASNATHFTKEDEGLLKFHGSYQQDDRDLRHERRKRGEEEAFTFMIRCAIPGGIVTADQYLALDALADQYANGTLRVTTRQGFQLHGVLKKNLKATIAAINQTLLTTLSACGDVSRNVMGCPAPLGDEAHAVLRRVTRELAVQLRPRSNAYHEIWLDGEKVASTQEEEPFYGSTYLPRKFKCGVSLVDDNCVDIYSYDAGLIAMVEGGSVVGYNVVVGGGMGMTHGKEDTIARLAEPLGFVRPGDAVEAVRTIATVFRDHGNRADRRHARLKYVIHQWGIDRFRDEFRRRASFKLEDWRPIPRPVSHDHLGTHAQGDGRRFHGVFVANGRIKDDGPVRMKSALREIVGRHRAGIALTPHQNVLLTDLTDAAVADVGSILDDHGVAAVERLSAARRHSIACPALPTCGLAMAESERLMPSVVGAFEAALTALGLRDIPISLRMTGCPNGCARPYTADIAFVGRRPGVYQVYVGGGLGGDRVVDLLADDVATADLVPTLRPLLESWASGRRNDESFSEFYQRLLGRTQRRQAITGDETPTLELVQVTLGR
ncbi:MAG: NADPH-dependent assimilatory sulfite reductase hemoprotein subunit [Planctomycetota bacterium]